jgi:hypothetical protein
MNEYRFPVVYRYLPYWKKLETDHAIDTMHIAKSVFQRTISTILDIPSKMNDGVRAHRDIQKIGIIPQFHHQERPNGKYYLPLTSFTLTLEQKKIFYRCIREVRVPQVSHQI